MARLAAVYPAKLAASGAWRALNALRITIGHNTSALSASGTARNQDRVSHGSAVKTSRSAAHFASPAVSWVLSAARNTSNPRIKSNNAAPSTARIAPV